MNEPRAVLDGLPGFGDAVIVSRLEGGVASRSYRVSHGQEILVLRIDTPEAARLGLDRRREHAVIEAVAAAGLGIAAIHCDPASGVLLRRWLPGRPWTREDLGQPRNLERLAAVLRRLHGVPFSGPRFDPLAAAARYAEQLGGEEALGHLRRLAGLHAQLPAVEPVLCHNDLVCDNVLQAGGPVLIDWEYAAPGDPFFDLAVVVEHHELGGDLASVLLRAYLGRPPQVEEERRLRVQCAFYRELLGLWNLRLRDL